MRGSPRRLHKSKVPVGSPSSVPGLAFWPEQRRGPYWEACLWQPWRLVFGSPRRLQEVSRRGFLEVARGPVTNPNDQVVAKTRFGVEYVV